MNLQEIKQFFLKKDQFEIICHASPDGDTLGSGFALCFALRQLGKKANVVCGDSIPEKYDYLTSHYKEETFTPEIFVTVDTADKILLGPLKDAYPVVHCNIDHHASNRQFALETYLDTKVSANCENVFHILNAMDIKIDGVMADALLTGIVTDTGFFRQGNTTPDSHIVAAQLMKLGANAPNLAKIHFDTVTKNFLEIQKMALETAEYHFDNQCVIFAVTLDMLEKYPIDDSELDGLVALARKIKGIEIGITIKQKTEDLFKISMRTSAKITASEICSVFGGGGHVRASGCAIKGSLQEVKSKLLKTIENKMKEK